MKVKKTPARGETSNSECSIYVLDFAAAAAAAA